jgi:hypothetical protein
MDKLRKINYLDGIVIVRQAAPRHISGHVTGRQARTGPGVRDFTGIS